MNQLVIKKKNELTQKKKKGFTLVELIIVIAIIAILAAMAIPKMGAIRETANAKADLATAKNMATVIATEMASGSSTYKPGASGTVDSTITNKLDGKSTPQSTAAGTATTFDYSIDKSGNITIKYTGASTNLYPVGAQSTDTDTDTDTDKDKDKE